MATSDPIRRASQRGQVLTRMLAELREQARRHPENERWCLYGITGQDDRKRDAARKLERMFEELSGLVEHVMILDMTASLELAARSTIGNYVGEIRKAGKARVEATGLPRHSLGIIRTARSYDGLAAIVDLLKGSIDPDLVEGLTRVGRARNAFAHGTDVTYAPDVGPDEAREWLIQALDVL